MIDSTAMPRIGFLLSHSFQYSYFEPIAARINKPLIFIETRTSTPFDFSKEFVASLPGTVVTIDTKNLQDLDGSVDILVCLTPVPVLKFFRKTKVVCLQYSLAKESYQYGAWRSVADLNLMFGKYSYDRVAPFCVADIAGNPRFDKYFQNKLANKKDAAVNSPDRPRKILYLPTYGELSSLAAIEAYMSSDRCNIEFSLRPHHMSEFTDAEVLSRLSQNPKVKMYTPYADSLALIDEADCVISDFSGAMFDAVVLGKPIVCIQPEHIPEQTILRTTKNSLEIAAAAEIGPIVHNLDKLERALARAMEGPEWNEARERILTQCFSNLGDASKIVLEKIQAFAEGRYPRTFASDQVGNVYRHYISKQNELRAVNKKLSDENKVLKSKKGGIKGGNPGDILTLQTELAEVHKKLREANRATDLARMAAGRGFVARLENLARRVWRKLWAS